MNTTPIEAAVAAAGSGYRLAKLVGVKPPTVHTWIKQQRIPAERVLAVEAATGISRHELRPDVFGPDPAQDRRQSMPNPGADRDD